jgi:ABC-type multidrug transport system ATPase subunit
VRIDGRVAFVPQDDALNSGLTLRDALGYAAALRMPESTIDERDARIAVVLDELGLEPHMATMIGNLSGGQRKRASIATQLLGDPDVLVLDEPTEGLDPGYAKVVMQSLRAIAESGRTVVIVTHSLEALQASDRVLFLAAGGAVAFFGTPKQAATYFKTRDTADVFLALDHAPHLWREKFRRSRLNQVSVLSAEQDLQQPAQEAKQAPRQVRLFLSRFVALLKGDRRHLVLMALQAPVIGALLWAVLPANALVPEADGEFSSKAGVVILFVTLSTTWLGVANAIREVVRERAIVRWEAASGLSPRAYIASKFVALGSLVTVQAALITFLATARQHSNDRFTLVAIAALAGLAATALGLALSSAATSSDRATALLPVTLVVQLVLAGEWAANVNVPLLHEARWLVGTRWSMEAMVATLHGDTAQFSTAIAMLSALTVSGVIAATVLVTRATRPAVATHHIVRTPMTTRIAIGACATAVVLSVGAGGAGVLALMNRPGPVALPTHASTTPQANGTVSTTPTTAVATVPVTAPPVAAPPVTAAPVRHAATTRTTTPEIDQIAADPQIVVPMPEATPPTLLAPSDPQATPATAQPKKNGLLTGWFQLFNPFAPKVNN